MASPASCHQPTDTMPFDLDSLKDKLDSATLDKLKSHVEDLSTRAETAEGKARTAAKESIDGRKALKAERDAAFERLGVATLEELEALPDAKGQADALKQVDAKVKKLERENAELKTASDTATGRLKALQRDATLAAAMDGLKFKHPADVRALLAPRLVEEGEDLLFKTDEGKLVPLKDGAAWFAKTRPDYVEASDAGGKGSGFRGTGGAGGGDKPAKKPERKDYPDEPAFYRASAAFASEQAAATT